MRTCSRTIPDQPTCCAAVAGTAGSAWATPTLPASTAAAVKATARRRWFFVDVMQKTLFSAALHIDPATWPMSGTAGCTSRSPGLRWGERHRGRALGGGGELDALPRLGRAEQ